MSAKSTVVTEQHFRYIAERTTPEDEFLRALRHAAVKAGIPEIWISPEQGAFIQILLRLCGARQVVEVGTLAGYSAIMMARALPPGGRVRTIEILDKHADFAKEWVKRSDVADRVEVICGPGSDVLPTIANESVDAMLLDADKAGYAAYLKEGLRIVRRNGLVMVDNAFAFGQLFHERPTDREVPAVRQFNEHMAGVTELQSIIVPIGDGCWVGVRK